MFRGGGSKTFFWPFQSKYFKLFLYLSKEAAHFTGYQRTQNGAIITIQVCYQRCYTVKFELLSSIRLTNISCQGLLLLCCLGHFRCSVVTLVTFSRNL